MLITLFNSFLKLNLCKCSQVKMNPINCTKFFLMRIKVKVDKTPWNTIFLCILSFKLYTCNLVNRQWRILCVLYLINRLGKNSMQTSNTQNLIGQISALSTLCITFLQHAFRLLWHWNVESLKYLLYCLINYVDVFSIPLIFKKFFF